MFGHKFARVILASTAIAGTCWALPAAAQTGAVPDRTSVDANGVDLFLGRVNFNSPVLSAGQDARTGLSYRRISNGGADNMWASIYVSGAQTTIAFNGEGDTFTLSGGVYVPYDANGATLTLAGGIYTYTGRDGSVMHFDTAKQGAYPNQTAIGLVTDMTTPSGATLTYTYDTLNYCVSFKQTGDTYACLQRGNAYRASTATSSGGYRLTAQYAAIDPWSEIDGETPDLATWGAQTGVVMSNTKISGSSTRAQTFATTDSGANTYIAITDPMSRTTTFRFASTGSGIKRPGKSTEDVTYTYDGSFRALSVTTPVGTTTYAYSDAAGVRTTTVTDPGGHATVYTFDIASNRMLSATNPLSKTTSWQYDASGRVTRATAPEGNYTQYTYDARGNVTETRNVAKSGSGLADIVATANYDATCSNVATCNQPNWTRDAKGNQTDYTYDPATGNVLTVTSPAATAGGTRPKATYSYTATSGVQLLTGTSTCQTTASCVGAADEVKATIGYNSNLLPTTMTKAAGDGSLTATTTVGYDDVGNVQTVDGPLSGTADTTTYRYDADREQVGAISADPDGGGALKRRAVRTTYNDRGIATLVETGTVNGTADTDWSAFSSLQQVATTLDTADRKAQVAVTAGGTTYALTQYSYDTDGRLDCSAVRMKPNTYGSLPSACTATTGTGDADRIIKMTYDNADRVTKTTSAYGTADASDDATSTYSDNGKVATATDANNNKTSYTYDGFDRLSKTNYPSTTKGSGTSSSTDYEQLGYDANSNVTSRLLRGGTLTIGYTYDNLNRLKIKDIPGGTTADVYYGYDLRGLLLYARFVSNTGLGITNAYDGLGRLSSTTNNMGFTPLALGYLYDAAGNPIRITHPDGNYWSYDYDGLDRVIAIRENGAAQVVALGYDDLGRRVSSARGAVVTTYGYDPASRLSSLTDDFVGTAGDVTSTYTYNSASQIVSKTRTNDSYAFPGYATATNAYAANGLNQYTGVGAGALGYDANGNLTSSGGSTFTYDVENRLISAAGTLNATLVYDPLGRLFQTSSTTTAATQFVYDGGEEVVEYDAASGTTARRYIHGPAADDPLLVYNGVGLATRRSLQADEQGSIASVANPDGTLLVINTYDEYGVPANNGGRLQYTGQGYIPELGMYYYKARIYSSRLGRFMQTDPIGYGDGMNWYNYVGGDPVNATDPTGNDLTNKWTKCYGNCGLGYANTPSEADVRADLRAALPGASNSVINGTLACLQTAGCVSAMLSSASSTVAGQLTFKTISGGQGKESWTIAWNVSGNSTGYVVQKIIDTVVFKDGTTKTFAFWEAWRVKSGSFTPYPGTDEFARLSLDVAQFSVRASASFYDHYALPSSFGAGSLSGDLPMTFRDPGLPAPTSGPIERSFTSPCHKDAVC